MKKILKKELSEIDIKTLNSKISNLKESDKRLDILESLLSSENPPKEITCSFDEINFLRQSNARSVGILLRKYRCLSRSLIGDDSFELLKKMISYGDLKTLKEAIRYFEDAFLLGEATQEELDYIQSFITFQEEKQKGNTKTFN